MLLSEREEVLVKCLTESILCLASVIHARGSSSASEVTRCDLNAAEARIVKAFVERVNPKDLEKLSTKLEAATAPLEKAVAENQPG